MSEAITEEIENRDRRGDILWFVSCGLITAVATFVRFFWLDVKPLHHDEGVNGFFLTTLFREGRYQYDPANYHGPDLYYIALAFTKVFGLNTLSVRWSVAIFGVLIVVLAFYLRRYIGRNGSLCAAFFLALSPGMTYISRYFIHEILFVFFGFTLVLAVLFFLERKRVGAGAVIWTAILLLICFLPTSLNLADIIGGTNTAVVWALRVAFFAVEAALVFFVLRVLTAWRDGMPIYLLLASASVVLLAATKETGFITIGTMIIAVVCVWIWRKVDAIEFLAKNRFTLFWVFNIIAVLGVAIQYVRIRAGFEAVYENFELAETDAQFYVFYGIFAMIALAAAAWIAFGFANRNKIENETIEDSHLDIHGFVEKTGAASLNQLIMIKSAIGAAAIIFVWFFVHYGIGLALAAKSDGKAGATGWSLGFTKVDLVIVGIAVLLSIVAYFFFRKEKQGGFPQDTALIFGAMIAVFLYVGALFFSSFFTYPEGLQKAFEAYAIWTKTGTADHTQNGRWAYFRWGMIIESPLLVMSALGTLIAFYKARHRFAMFVGLWALGLFLAYTIIPYKTPWLALSFLLPMCIVAGYAFNELLASRQMVTKIFGGVLAIVSAVILAYQTYDINFVRYDSDTMPYIYAHTTRGFHDLTKKIEYYAGKSRAGKDSKIEIVSPEYWPMPWYLNNYPNAVFQGKIVDANSAEMIVAKHGTQDADIVSRYGVRYRRAGKFPLRPGVELVLLVRNDLADRDTEDIFQVYGEPMTVTPGDDEPLDDEDVKVK